jgi:methyl-accepting chemotaxis protein
VNEALAQLALLLADMRAGHEALAQRSDELSKIIENQAKQIEETKSKLEAAETRVAELEMLLPDRPTETKKKSRAK